MLITKARNIKHENSLSPEACASSNDIDRDSKISFSASATFELPIKKKAPGKRRASSPPEACTNEAKKTKIISASSDDPLRQPHHNASESEANGIVLRKYYPHEMSNARCLAYNQDQLPRPIELLESALRETAEQRDDVKVKDSVVHWFQWDLRTKDNKGLHMASKKAQEKGVPLVTMYIVSPQDYEAHLTSPVRVDFALRTLAVLKEDLAALNIPLYVETVPKRRNIDERVLELFDDWGVSHVYKNVEYEVDELRRDARMVRKCIERGIAMDVTPDTCVVAPGELHTGAGKQYSVYSPWFRAWVSHIHNNLDLLNLFGPPSKNPENAREKFAKLFESSIPDAPENKRLGDEEKTRFRAMWPCGEHEAEERLKKFADEKIGAYQAKRNFPADRATSCLSVCFSSGTLSARTAIKTARDHNNTKRLDGGHQGIMTWISEVAWRDFYKHVLAHWPYVWSVFRRFVIRCGR